MKIRIVLLLGEDERTIVSYSNLVKKFPYRFQDPETLFLTGILQFHQPENILTFRELTQLSLIPYGSVSKEQILIPSPEMTLEDILEKTINTLSIHLISHGREDPIGALTIKTTPYKSIKIGAETLARFFLHNRPRDTFEINLIDLIACNSLRLALCLSLLIPKIRILGYENPVVIQENGEVALYDPISGKTISTSSASGRGVVPKVRFDSGSIPGKIPKMFGFPSENFEFESMVAEITAHPEFQRILENIKATLHALAQSEDHRFPSLT